MNDQDAQLIDQALAGDSSAFGLLVRKYQDRLFNSLVHMVGCEEDARDVAQDAFVQAYVKLDTFKREAGFYTWLYRIAFNVSISRKRRKRPVVSVEAQRESAGLEPVDEALPTEGLEQSERVQQVRAAISLLTEEHRQVLVLREMDGCDYETISEMLEVPVGTVRSRLHRARMQLREQLQEYLQEDLQ